MQKALVIGGGAIGAAVGGELERLGWAPRFIGRQGATALTATFETDVVKKLNFPKPTADDVAAASLCFVAVKAFDLEAALKNIAGLKAGVPVVPLSNGATWDIVAHAAAARPDLAWRLGYSTFGVTEVGPASFALRSRTGELSFGPLVAGNGERTACEKELTDAKGLFVWHQNIDRLVKRKWLYNTVINTLCAARGLPKNGALLGDLATLAAVFNEALTYGEERWGPWTMERNVLFQGMRELIESTEANENSMARDKRLGRRTESAFLAGLATDKKRYPLLTELHSKIERP